jgi:hypothetical protein
VNPHFDFASEIPPASLTFLQEILQNLKQCTRDLQIIFDDIDIVKKAPYIISNRVPEEENGTFDVLCILYFLVVSVPVYYDRRNIEHMRQNFAFWLLLDGSLPI